MMPAFQSSAVYLRENGGERFILTSSRENGLFTGREFARLYRTVLKQEPRIKLLTPKHCRHTYFVLYDTLSLEEESIFEEQEDGSEEDESHVPEVDTVPEEISAGEARVLQIESKASPVSTTDDTSSPAAAAPVSEKAPHKPAAMRLPDTIWKAPAQPKESRNKVPSDNNPKGLERPPRDKKDEAGTIFGFKAGDRIRYKGIGYGVITKMTPLKHGRDAIVQINFANSQKSGKYMMQAASRFMQKI